MKLRTVAIIGAILLILALSIGVGFKLAQTTESQRAETIDNKTFEPHMLFGCASYRVMMSQQQKEAKKKNAPAKKPITKKPAKEQKK